MRRLRLANQRSNNIQFSTEKKRANPGKLLNNPYRFNATIS